MPFEPNPLEYHWGDTEKDVEWSPSGLAGTPWSVHAVSFREFGGADLVESLWSFTFPPEQNGASVKAILHCDFDNIESDEMLAYYWSHAPSDGYTLDFKVQTADRIHDLVVKIMP